MTLEVREMTENNHKFSERQSDQESHAGDLAELHLGVMPLLVCNLSQFHGLPPLA
jgi:hypothetical protein